jgi:hypothetical protein
VSSNCEAKKNYYVLNTIKSGDVKSKEIVGWSEGAVLCRTTCQSRLPSHSASMTLAGSMAIITSILHMGVICIY